MFGHIGPITMMLRQMVFDVSGAYLDRWDAVVAADDAGGHHREAQRDRLRRQHGECVQQRPLVDPHVDHDAPLGREPV